MLAQELVAESAENKVRPTSNATCAVGDRSVTDDGELQEKNTNMLVNYQKDRQHTTRYTLSMRSEGKNDSIFGDYTIVGMPPRAEQRKKKVKPVNFCDWC